MAVAPNGRPSSARDVRLELDRSFPRARRSLAERLQTFVLAGRTKDLARLENWADSGRTRMLTVYGEPGIGRTALLDAFAARSTLEGRAILRFSGDHDREADAFTTILRRQVEVLGQQSATTSNEAEPASVDERVATWARILGTRSCLLLVDDAERLSSATRSLLRRIALDPASSLRVVQAQSTFAPASEDEAILEAAGQADVLHLAPLDDDGVDRLIEARLGQPPPDGLVAHVRASAAGHPGMIVDLLREAAQSGALAEHDHGVSFEPSPLRAVGGSFVESRIARLDASSQPAHDVARALAVLGGSATTAELAHLVSSAADEGIEALTRSGLVRLDAERRVHLSPPALVAHMLESASPAELAPLHRAALTLERLDPADRFEHLVRLGDHAAALECAEALWQESKDRAPAARVAQLVEESGGPDPARWRDRAAQAAYERGRYDEAAKHWEAAVDHSPDDGSRGARLERLASAYFRCGRLSDVERVIDRALALEVEPAVRGRVLVTSAARYSAAGHQGAGLALAEQAIELSTSAGDDEALGHAALTAASILLTMDRVDDAVRRTEQAADAYCRCGQELGLSRVDQLRGLVHRRQGQPGEAERAYQSAVARARVAASRLGLEESHLMLAQLYGDLGRGSECREAYRAALRIALEDGRGRGVTLATMNLAQFEGLSGRPREAVRLSKRAIGLARQYLPVYLSYAHRSLAQGFRALGQPKKARPSARRALALALRGGVPEERAWSRGELVRSLFELGRLAEASQAAKQDETKQDDWTPGHAALELLGARLLLRRGDKAGAAAKLQHVTRWAQGRAVPYIDAIAAQLRAELALVEARLSQATQELGTALAKFESIPAPHDRAMALFDLARLASQPEVDGRAPVGDWLRQAVELFGQLGDRRRRARAVELEVEWLRRQHDRGPLDHDKGLLEKVGQLLHSLPNRTELMRQAMRLAVEQFDAERGVLLVEDEGTKTLEPVAQHGAEDATSEREATQFSRKLVARVVETGTGVLVYDAPIDPKAATESVKKLNLRALLCVPMFSRDGRVVGAVYLDSRRPNAFGQGDRRLLEGFGMLMAAALETSRATEKLARENLALRQDMASRVRAGLIGSSRALQRIVPAIERAARSQVTVLLTGETGTGKDLVARVIHQLSNRTDGPYISVNCGAISRDLMESELFGIADRAASGVRGRPGHFQRAHKGTLFLDEIGEMPLQQQAALLSAIDDREISPVGGDGPIAVDVRIVAATNADLVQLVEQGKFRRDLYHRLLVFPIELPPLRDRKGDIPELARHFATQFASREGRAVPELAADFLADLMQRDWSGNVRELEHFVERAMIMNEQDVLHSAREERTRTPRGARAAHLKLAEQADALERRLLLEALQRAGGIQYRAARDLGLSEPTFRNKLAKHGIASRRKLRDS
jgi:Nif-specific regulatory protein